MNLCYCFTSKLTRPGLPVGLAPVLVWAGWRGSEGTECEGTWRQNMKTVNMMLLHTWGK